MDATDRQILSLLQENAKATISEIAEKCHLSRTPVFERIRKMEDSGVIKGYSVNIDPHKVGLPLHAFCNVSLKEHASSYLEQFEREVLELTEVVAAYHTAGMFDYLLEIRVGDMEAYRKFMARKLAGIDNIGNVQSFFIMNDLKSACGLPLSAEIVDA